MGKRTHHVSASIDSLLELSNEELEKMFEGTGEGLRNQFEGLKKMGHKRIPSVGCEGFDHVMGCPGHEELSISQNASAEEFLKLEGWSEDISGMFRYNGLLSILKRFSEWQASQSQLHNISLEGAKIGDENCTIEEWAPLHVDFCYEPSSPFDRDCMIKCVIAGYNARNINASQPINNGWVKPNLNLYLRDYILPERITLCGSTKFKNQFEQVNKWLSLKGHVVYTVSFFGHADNIPLTIEQKKLLDRVHKSKIDNSDAILVIDVDGYIGESTKSEIAHARFVKKKIFYLTNFLE